MSKLRDITFELILSEFERLSPITNKVLHQINEDLSNDNKQDLSNLNFLRHVLPKINLFTLARNDDFIWIKREINASYYYAHDLEGFDDGVLYALSVFGDEF